MQLINSRKSFSAKGASTPDDRDGAGATAAKALWQKPGTCLVPELP